MLQDHISALKLKNARLEATTRALLFQEPRSPTSPLPEEDTEFLLDQVKAQFAQIFRQFTHEDGAEQVAPMLHSRHYAVVEHSTEAQTYLGLPPSWDLYVESVYAQLTTAGITVAGDEGYLRGGISQELYIQANTAHLEALSTTEALAQLPKALEAATALNDAW